MKRVLAVGLGLAMVFIMARTSLAETLTLQSDTSVEYFSGTEWLYAVKTQQHSKWVSINGANWIWLFSNWTTAPITQILRKQFSIPDNAKMMTGTIEFAADNGVSLYLNDVFIGGHKYFDVEENFTSTQKITVTNFIGGVNILKLVVTNTDCNGCINPAGVIFKAVINYEVSNTSPLANAQSVTTDENIPKTVILTGTDADSDPLIYSVTTQPSHGMLSGIAPNLTYTPVKDYSGPDSFAFKVSDGKADSAPAIVSINVNPVNIDNGSCKYTQAQLDQAVKTEQLKWDANGDGKIGLEDIIRMLQVIAGLRP